MPSHTNPNKPSSLKARHTAAAKAKRQRVNKPRIGKPAAPRTSQAIRKSAPLSKKKARKMEKKVGYARRRAEEEEFEKMDVEMRDVGDPKEQSENGKSDKPAEAMDLDVVT